MRTTMAGLAEFERDLIGIDQVGPRYGANLGARWVGTPRTQKANRVFGMPLSSPGSGDLSLLHARQPPGATLPDHHGTSTVYQRSKTKKSMFSVMRSGALCAAWARSLATPAANSSSGSLARNESARKASLSVNCCQSVANVCVTS